MLRLVFQRTRFSLFLSLKQMLVQAECMAPQSRRWPPAPGLSHETGSRWFGHVGAFPGSSAFQSISCHFSSFIYEFIHLGPLTLFLRESS